MTVPAFELIAQDPRGLDVAAAVGADRIELCCALELGGLTPSQALIEAAVAARDAGGPGVHVLVRSRPGDFEYSPAELDLMLADAVAALQRGADGVVVGASRDGALDLSFVDRMVATAGDASVTVHRVVDSLADPVGAVSSLRDRGVRRVLTSGGADKAPDGVGTIAAMVQAAQGRIEIMAGGGVSVASVPALIDAQVSAIHASASGNGQPDLQVGRQFKAAITDHRGPRSPRS